MIAITPDGLVITDRHPLYPRTTAQREYLSGRGWTFSAPTVAR